MTETTMTEAANDLVRASSLSNRSSVEWRRPETGCANIRPGLTLKSVLDDWRADMDSIRRCSVEGCDRTGRITKAYCPMHYTRFLRNGDAGEAGLRHAKQRVVAECHVEGCDRRAKAMGMCSGHYEQHRSGRPLSIYRSPASGSAIERLMANSDRTGECWIWTALTNHDGYGLVGFRGKNWLAHRLSYVTMVAPIPDGASLDHVCHAPSCINPDHLREVTAKQNQENRRPTSHGRSGVRGVSWNTRQGKWKATVMHNRRLYHAGFFDNIPDAEASVVAMRNELYSHNDLDRIA